ncbi:MAG: AmmeMemoRadiSam system protein B [Deferribacterota bacterium]|nr:AmmeMemoRadiSam system protein B [Deferribacterota bacterium]
MYRELVVAGYFYPANKRELINFFENNRGDATHKDVKSAIVPHAGYVYSGKTAFKTLSSIDIPSTVILIGPNHTGLGERVSVYPEGSWASPFGDVVVNKGITEKLIDKELVFDDYYAHLREHSLEVVVPMLKYLRKDVEIVPITIKGLSLNECLVLAKKISTICMEYKGEILIVVSSDFNHYEDAEITDKKDMIAIECILNMDPVALYEKVNLNNITMCGYIPAVIALQGSKELGAKKAILIEHTHSGYVSGDYNQVVGYAGIVII